MAKKIILKFIEKKKVASKTYSFYFDRAGIDFNFIAGQYVRISLDIKKPDMRGSFRDFTISSSPLDSDLVVTTKVIRSAFKKKLFSLKKGDKVNFFGPMGNLTLKNKKKKIFLAGGIGITPFYSIIRFASIKKTEVNMTLIVSFSSNKEIVFYNELLKIEKENKNIKIIYLSDRITKDVIKKNISNLSSLEFMVVGPGAMVEDTKEELVRLGISEDDIKTEDYTGY